MGSLKDMENQKSTCQKILLLMSPRCFSVGEVEEDEDSIGKIITKAEMVSFTATVAPPASNRQISSFFFWLLEGVELMGCRCLASLLWRRPSSKSSLPSKAVSRPTASLQRLICGISISHDDFASERGAGVKTGAGEILIHVELGGEKREATVTLSERQWAGGLFLWEEQTFPRAGSLKYLLAETFQAFLCCAAKPTQQQQQLILLRLQQPGLVKWLLLSHGLSDPLL